MTLDRADVRYLVGLAGGVLVVAGTAALAVWLALVAAGALLIVLAVLMRPV